MKNEVIVGDKVFELFIPESEIATAVKTLAGKLNSAFEKKKPLLLVCLKGAFMFASDLIKELNFSFDLVFIQISSYSGLTSTGNVKAENPIPETLYNRDVIIVEDIVDTGKTVDFVCKELLNVNVKSIHVLTLLFKPASCISKQNIDYFGFQIPSDFVVGYGLDYNEEGRNLTSIYKLKKTI